MKSEELESINLEDDKAEELDALVINFEELNINKKVENKLDNNLLGEEKDNGKEIDVHKVNNNLLNLNNIENKKEQKSDDNDMEDNNIINKRFLQPVSLRIKDILKEKLNEKKNSNKKVIKYPKKKIEKEKSFDSRR